MQPFTNAGSRLMSAELLTIVVGPDKVKFMPHKDVLCSRSDHFKNAFEKGFRESGKNEMSFPEDDPEAFGLLLRWMYESRLEVPSSILSVPPVRPFIQLYVLADKLVLENLQNEVMDVITTLHNGRPPSYEIVRLAYHGTMHNASLRMFLMETVVWPYAQGSRKGQELGSEENLISKAGGDLAVDFAKKLLACFNNSFRNPQDGSHCRYHIHKDTTKCL